MKELATEGVALDQGGGDSADGATDLANGAEGAEHEEGQREDGGHDGSIDAGGEGDGASEAGEGGEAGGEASGQAGEASSDADLARQTRELLSFLQQSRDGQQGQGNGQGQQGQQGQQQQGQQPQQFSPVIGDDFIRKAAEHMDEAAVDAVVKPLAKIINAQAEALHKFQQETQPHIQQFQGHFQQVQQERHQRETAAVHNWFDKLPNQAARYGTPDKCSPAQFASRDRVYRAAKTLLQASELRARAGGQGLTFPQALKLAHVADSHGETTSEATRQVRSTLQRRARGITVPPGRRGTQGSGEGDDRQTLSAAKKFVASRHSAD
jgi:hypothetical protein